MKYEPGFPRQSVLKRHPKARLVRIEVFADKFPLYEVRVGLFTLGRAHGSTAAWRDAAQKINLMFPPAPQISYNNTRRTLGHILTDALAARVSAQTKELARVQEENRQLTLRATLRRDAAALRIRDRYGLTPCGLLTVAVLTVTGEGKEIPVLRK